MDLTQLSIIAAGIALVFLAIATLLMPLYVISINTKLAAVSKTLAAMERMMRSGR